MSIKSQWLFRIATVLLPWLSVPLLGVRNVKRFLPASILVWIMGIIDVQIGKKRRWWTFYYRPSSYLFNEFMYHVGPFLVGSMWILKWTYGNLMNFTLLNTVVDAFFAGPITSYSKKLKVYKRVRLNPFQFFFYFFYKSFFLYAFQYLYESRKKST
ncbi:MAG TPA: hypothetical protein VEY51_03955 [Chondromyces sp.]|nr:hypothetical protein [Chondromyces sp.]